MESKFFGFFKKSRQTKTNEITNEISLVRHSEDIQVEIRSDTIDISLALSRLGRDTSKSDWRFATLSVIPR